MTESPGAQTDGAPILDSPPNDGSPLLDLEPALAWRFFDGIRRIPRPSKREERIAAAMRAWAAGRGYDNAADAAGNV
ncbi:MAG: hypothetical protein AAGF23_26430, partial [Acidobacteriota bacterium]